MASWRTCPSRPKSDRVKARLIEDGGAAASDAEQFFRSPPFLDGRGRDAHAGRWRASELRLPLIVRPDRLERATRRDLALRLPGRATAPRTTAGPAAIDWSETGLVSIFVRDRIGERACFAGGTVRSQVHVADGERRGPQAPARADPPQRAPRLGRCGWSPVPRRSRRSAPASSGPTRETMARTGAAERYLYPTRLFRAAAAQRAAAGWCSPSETASRPGRRDRGARATATCTTTWAAPRTRRSRTRR